VRVMPADKDDDDDDDMLRQLYKTVRDKMMEMQKLSMSWIEVQFLHKAVDILCHCRQTLMYTYVFAYYLRKNNQSIIFEVLLSAHHFFIVIIIIFIIIGIIIIIISASCICANRHWFTQKTKDDIAVNTRVNTGLDPGVNTGVNT